MMTLYLTLVIEYYICQKLCICYRLQHLLAGLMSLRAVALLIASVANLLVCSISYFVVNYCYLGSIKFMVMVMVIIHRRNFWGTRYIRTSHSLIWGYHPTLLTQNKLCQHYSIGLVSLQL